MVLLKMIIFIFVVIFIFILNLFVFLRNMFLSNKEKLCSFECGFNSFNLYREFFSIQFFKILLIFLLFDIEIIVILPFPLGLVLDKIIFISFVFLIFFIVFGLYFE